MSAPQLLILAGSPLSTAQLIEADELAEFVEFSPVRAEAVDWMAMVAVADSHSAV